MICGRRRVASAMIKDYEKYRKAGMRLNSKLMSSKMFTKEALNKAMEMLGVRDSAGVAVYHSQIEIDATMDFALCDMRVGGGRTPVEAYMGEVGPDGDLERILLEARIKSRTSLFRVESADAAAGTVDLSDLLVEGQRATIHDMGLSATMSSGLALFMRLFTYPKFSTTSGIAFVFPGDRAPAMVSKYMKMREKPGRRGPASRYALFFRMQRRYSMPISYTDDDA